MANMKVEGAGTAAVNGTYVENGTEGGKPRYVMDANYFIFWTGSRWNINNGFPYPDGVTYYYSSDNVATPDLATTWVSNPFFGGSPPVPTVTAEGGEPEPPAKKYRYKPVSQLTGSIRQLGM